MRGTQKYLCGGVWVGVGARDGGGDIPDAAGAVAGAAVAAVVQVERRQKVGVDGDHIALYCMPLMLVVKWPRWDLNPQADEGGKF